MYRLAGLFQPSSSCSKTIRRLRRRTSPHQIPAVAFDVKNALDDINAAYTAKTGVMSP